MIKKAVVSICCLLMLRQAVAQPVMDSTGISRKALEYYLSRAVTMAEFLAVDPYGNDGTYPNKEDDIRLIRNIGAKFIGRAIYRWGHETDLGNADFLAKAQALMRRVHANDPEVIFQAAVFEAISRQTDSLTVPEWTFQAMGLPVEHRRFRYADMLNTNGKFVDHWGKGRSVPDITRTESQLWLMFLCGTYIRLGCEALHMGQVNLMAMADRDWAAWDGFLQKLRAFARKGSRRGWVLLDAHTPHGGMVAGGRSLLDFNSFPLRIKPVVDKPQQGVLQVGYLDALYGRSKGCVTPSGWQCASLPYLVEFDNFGISRTPGVADTTSHYIWGYDEISWFYLQPESYRNQWLRYAYDWLKKTDSNGFLQMPIARVVTIERGKGMIRNRGNTRSPQCPDGLNVEETVRRIWRTR
ncbi:hypothetical protein [Chitinophaga caseinilytica]|uniref:hypothetical protein n=1 Tax=Chitinophaga caseinilytica TaxID=2267521 RepID=UPI003C2DFFFF